MMSLWYWAPLLHIAGFPHNCAGLELSLVMCMSMAQRFLQGTTMIGESYGELKWFLEKLKWLDKFGWAEFAKICCVICWDCDMPGIFYYYEEIVVHNNIFRVEYDF